MNNKNSNRGFKLAIIALLLFIVIMILQMAMFHSGSDIFLRIFGFVIFSIGIIAIIGLINSLKGFREPNSLEKITGLLINCGFVVLFVFIILAHINDILKAFK